MIHKDISLRNLHRSDRKNFYSWINDEEVIRYSLSLFQKISSEAEIDKWFRSVLDDKKSFSKGIIFDEKLVWYAGIAGISAMNHNGEYFILIGDKSVRGQGIGTEVTKMIVRLAFEEFNLNRVSLTVSDVNNYANKAYLNAGFV